MTKRPQPKALQKLATDRLRLGALTLDDQGRMVDLLHEEGVRRYLCDDVLLPAPAIRALIENGRALWPRGLGLWRVEQAADGGGWLGFAGLQPVPAAIAEMVPELAGEVEPIVALRQPVWGQGFATEALTALAAHAFGTLRLKRLVALVDQPNLRSHRMMERCGFRPVGQVAGPAHPLRIYRRDQLVR